MIDSLLRADVDAFTAAARADLAAARAAVAACKRLPAGASVAQVLAAYDAIGHPLDRTGGLVHLFFQVHPDAAVRQAAAGLEQELSRLRTELSLDRELYERLSALDPGQAPDAVARRILEHALRDFRRSGVDRDEPTRQRVTALNERIVELGQDFARHIAGDVRRIELDGPAELEGLPADFVASHPPRADGKVVVTTDPTDFMPFMKFCKRRPHRRALYQAYLTRATPANLPVLDALLAARHELATVLGYESWAAYATEDKMIRSAARAQAFVDRVAELTRERAERDLAELRALQRRVDPAADQVRDYDRAYLTELLRQEQHDFDSRQARPYFGYEAVRDGVLATASRLYGLTIRRRTGVTAWHPDVEAWEVLDGGAVVAHFLLDMHPRADKFKHAAMFALEHGRKGSVLPSAVLVCNMSRPTAGDPGLLDPSDVRTFFHEFGHLLHHLLAGEQRWLCTSGISTEWDFVEVPSQLFEEWFEDAGVLSTFARHHVTGAPIPPDLVERMRRASHLGKGLQTRGQMFYAALSLDYYSRDPRGRDTTEVLKQVRRRYLPLPHEEGTALQASFGHLDGYSALYYTYMWSLVLAKDVFSAFAHDLMDRSVAERYRRTILAPGGSRDAEQLLADFLGREHSFDAFETWLAA